MMRNISTGSAAIILAAALVGLGVLSLYRTTSAQQQGGQLPFGNSVEQRNSMIRELQEIKALLREQNTLLRTLAEHAARDDSQTPNRSAKPR